MFHPGTEQHPTPPSHPLPAQRQVPELNRTAECPQVLAVASQLLLRLRHQIEGNQVDLMPFGSLL